MPFIFLFTLSYNFFHLIFYFQNLIKVIIHKDLAIVNIRLSYFLSPKLDIVSFNPL